MSVITTGAFWLSTLERAVRSFAGALAALWSVNGMGLLDIDWVASFSAAGFAALYSVVLALATAGVGGNGPGITEETVTKNGT